jgi:hypothetical protein
MSKETGARSSAYWRDRAEEAWTKSEAARDALAAETLRRVARTYELMARQAAATEGPLN